MTRKLKEMIPVVWFHRCQSEWRSMLKDYTIENDYYLITVMYMIAAVMLEVES